MKKNFTFIIAILYSLLKTSEMFAQVIGAGGSHSLRVCTDNTARSWGNNAYGQLGDGTTIYKTTPVQVSSLTGITAVAAGREHSLFLKNNGTVWACGYNTNGQLGDGTIGTSQYTPVQISSLTGITAVAAGYSHSIFLKNDGTVWACGNNASGQLGDGTTVAKSTPVLVSSLSNITEMTAGIYHSIFLKNDGTVWACGKNFDGQLGDGTTVAKFTPVQVTSLCTVIGIDEQLANDNISIYPNPNNGSFTLTFTGIEDNEANIKVLNIIGQTVYYESASIKRNEYLKEIELGKINTGIYLIQINVGEIYFFKKLVILK